MATACSWARLTPRSPEEWPSDVKASMTAGAATKKTAVMTTRTTDERLTMAEMARQPSRVPRVDSQSTKTGMKVADSTPPRTTS